MKELEVKYLIKVILHIEIYLKLKLPSALIKLFIKFTATQQSKINTFSILNYI